MRSRVLFLSGHPDDARNLRQMLRQSRVDIDYATSLQEARILLSETDYAVVLTEAALADGNWLDVLHLVRSVPREPQVIVTDAQADASFWAQALNLGAYDLITQPFYEPEVCRILDNACSRRAYARYSGAAAV